MPRLRLAALLAAFALIISGPACKRDKKGGDMNAAESPPPLNLDPLPDAPEINVDPEALPGADGTLAVVVARPKGPTYGNFRPTITFSKPVAPMGTISHEETLAVPATITPALEGKWKWLGSASVEFVPKGTVPYSTEFKVSVRKDLAALDGSVMKDGYSWEFSTPKPRIQEVDPRNSFLWVTPEQKFTVVIDQRVKDLAKHTRLKVNGTETKVKVVSEKQIQEEEQAHGYRNKQTRYELVPVKPLPLRTKVDLVISGDLRGAEGPLTLGKDSVHGYQTYGPMKIEKLKACQYAYRCSWGPLVLETTNRVMNPQGFDELKKLLKIEPKVDINWDQVGTYYRRDGGKFEGATVMLPGTWKPGIPYKVTIEAGLKDEFGQKAGPFNGSIKFDDLDPRIDPGSNVALLESSGDGALPLNHVNVTRATAKVWELTPSETARALYQTWRSKAYYPPRPGASHVIALKGKKNSPKWTPLKLGKTRKNGIYLVKLNSRELTTNPKYPWQRRVVAQVTDLGVHAKLGATKSVVWVTRLSDGKSVGDAEVELFDQTGRSMWKGKTNNNGLAELPGMAKLAPKENRWNVGYTMVSATKSGDTGVTLSEWSDGLYPWAFELSSGWDGHVPSSLGVVFADRGIYRPGDEVHLKGVVRYRKFGELKSPTAGSTVKLTVEDSRGKEVHAKTVKITKFGTFADGLTLDKGVPLGTYYVSAHGKIGGNSMNWSGNFRVEEYRPPQFRVDVKSLETDVTAGDALNAKVAARYLFGGAMADADVSWSVVRSSNWFEPPGNEGFEFGNQTWWWDDHSPDTSTDVFASGTGSTDQNGNFEITPGKAETPGDKTWSYTLEAEVEDVNRQRIANRTSVTVHPAAVYVGVKKSSSGFAEANKPVDIEMIAARPDGERVEGADIALTVKRRVWKTIRKKGVGGRWYTESEAVEEDAAKCEESSERTPVKCSFKPELPGLYVMQASVTDDEGRTQTTRASFYVVGDGWVSWQRNDTDRIDLEADKTLYDVGETAKILVKSPYKTAEAVLTVEREGVLSSRRITLTGAATSLDIPITEDMVPNTFIGIVIARGRVPADKGIESGDDPGRPAVRVGYKELKVEKKTKRLTVKVEPNKKDFRPREKVTVNLNVTDHTGAGVGDTEVTAWAVDEGVLRLTSYTAPDPVQRMHPERGLSTRIAEPLIHLVYRRQYSEKGFDEGGGGGGGDPGVGGIRNKFKTTVLFAPNVVTDSSGNAEVTFELPDNLTTFRIMAIAVTQGDRFGVGKNEIAVAKPLLALPALPRFARAGDEFEAGVVVHVHGKGIKKAQVTATIKGSELVLDDSGSKTVRFDDGKAKEVRFKFKAEKPGLATLRFAVSGEGERDAVEHKIPVHLPVGMEAVAIYGDTKEKSTEGLVAPNGVRAGIGGMDISMSSTLMGNFDENMRQLIDYPYGCLEQLSSRLVPFVALRELHGKFGVEYEGTFHENFGTRDPDVIVQKTITEIERLQNYDGGFKYWSSSDCSSYWASSYSTLALHRAHEVGYTVDPTVLKKAKKFLASTIAPGKAVRCSFRPLPPGDYNRVFALYVLARSGSPKSSYYGELYKRRDKLPLFGQAMLADAMYVGNGNRDQARTVMTELLNHAKESPKGVHFEENDALSYAQSFSSDTRTTALVLQTLTTVSPDHPYVSKIGRYLTGVRQGNGRFRNTQEAAFALMALVDVVRTKEKDTPDFKAVVSLGNEVIAEETFKGRSMDVKKKNVTIDKLAALGGQVPFTFEKKGKGVFYYSALLRYAPEEIPMESLDRGLVVQRWFEPFTGGGQSKRFYAGDLIRVRVRVASHMERNYVAVDVPLPAGLEPVDTSLATSAQNTRQEDSYDYESEEDIGYELSDDYNPWLYSFWSPFNHTEKRDDRVVLFADHLPPGVHVSDFVVRATTPGEFMLKPAHAEEMYAPEVFGRSEGGRFRVIDSQEVSAR